MSHSPILTRRTALAGAAALPLAAATATAARAAAPIVGAGTAPFQRVSLGGFDVTTILAGSRSVPEPQNIFGMNVDAETFNSVSAKAHLPVDAAQFFFTPTVVNTGAELVLLTQASRPMARSPPCRRLAILLIRSTSSSSPTCTATTSVA